VAGGKIRVEEEVRYNRLVVAVITVWRKRFRADYNSENGNKP